MYRFLLAALLLCGSAHAQIIGQVPFLGSAYVGAAPTGGLGDVVGPAGATDTAAVRFDLATGKLVQNSDFLIANAAASNVTVASSVGNALTIAPATGVLNVTGSLSSTSFLSTDTVLRASDSATCPAAIAGDAQICVDSAGTGHLSVRQSTGDGGALVDIEVSSGGDVVGPAGATDTAATRFNLATGKLVQNSDFLIADAAASNVTVASSVGNALTIAPATGVLNVTGSLSATSFLSTDTVLRASDTATCPAAIAGDAQICVDSAGTGHLSVRQSSGDGGALIDLESGGTAAQVYSTRSVTSAGSPDTMVVESITSYNSSGGVIVANLPDCEIADNGKDVLFYATTTGNAITVTATVDDTVDGVASQLIVTAKTSIRYVCFASEDDWKGF